MFWLFWLIQLFTTYRIGGGRVKCAHYVPGTPICQ
jgi:hypothetical protein